MKPLFNLLFAFILILTCNSAYAQKAKEFHEPAGRGDLEAVKQVIEKGGKVDKLDVAGQTALMWASEGGHMEVIKYLIEKGADVNILSSKYGRGSALIYAAAAGRLETVEYLVEHGANINAANTSQNETALIWAVAMGHPEVVKYLLEKGADKTIINKNKQNAMDVAKKVNRDDMIKLLEENK
jgi:ankyrin repeat protein